MRILVLGATGMLGNAMVKILSENGNFTIFGTVRTDSSKRFFKENIAKRIISGIDVEQPDSLMQAFTFARPDVVINCIGLIKQLSGATDPVKAISMNSLFPHRLARLADLTKARLIHISTDCVFDGSRGGYTENDDFEAKDLYGMSKYLGEVSYPHTITLRTSIIGHELKSKKSLVDWFLSQKATCKGYKKAIFSGLPTVVLAKIIGDVVIPQKELSGIYHVAAEPINKFDLLKLIALVYGKSIRITSDENLVIDRSLNADKFRAVTGYIVPEWPELIRMMHTYRC